MEENKNSGLQNVQPEENGSSFNFATIFATFILNWQWFLLEWLPHICDTPSRCIRQT